jgi:hypothetical protein
MFRGHIIIPAGLFKKKNNTPTEKSSHLTQTQHTDTLSLEKQIYSCGRRRRRRKLWKNDGKEIKFLPESGGLREYTKCRVHADHQTRNFAASR